jgi:exosortase
VNIKEFFTQLIHDRGSILLKTITILFSIAIIYNQDLIILVNEATTGPQTSYILIIPFLIGYLIYRKRKFLNTITSLPSNLESEIIGALLCITALALYLAGSYTFHPLEYHILSIPIFLSGYILLLFNTQTLKTLAFPIAFLLFLVPLPFETLYTIGGIMANYSAEITTTILKATGVSATIATTEEIPAIIIQKSDTSLTFSIDVACSGIYSLLTFTAFSSFTAYILRGPIQKRILVFFLSLPLIYALNILRILTIIFLGVNLGIQMSTELFHIYGGWILIFIGTLIILYSSEKLLKLRLTSNPPPPCTHENLSKNDSFCERCGRILKEIPAKISRRDISKITLLLLATSLIGFFQFPVFALSRSPAKIVSSSQFQGIESAQILPQINNYTLKFLYRDATLESELEQDANLVYAYFPNDTSKRVIQATVEIAGVKENLHSWDKCFAAWSTVTLYDTKEFQMMENPPVIGQSFAFKDRDEITINVALYWYENSLFITNSTVEQKFVKITLMSVIDALPDRPQMEEEQLLPIAKEIVGYWQPVKQWSQIVLSFAKYRKELLITTSSFTIFAIVFCMVKMYSDKRSLRIAYTKISSKEERQILLAASKTKYPTIQSIASTYYKLSGKPITHNTLLKRLEEAEKANLTKKEIINYEDNPLCVWRTTISVLSNTKLES